MTNTGVWRRRALRVLALAGLAVSGKLAGESFALFVETWPRRAA